ncbi:MAG TPA: hypothetical protein VGI45_19740 [Terracidiphilus sp.]|jgi:uncharacterized membrane protein
MSVEVWAMVGVGIAVLVAGLILARERFGAAQGGGKIIVLGPVFEAVALAVFAMEHFTAAHTLATIVPRWLPWPLFWTYFFGVALLAAAISFILWRWVRWSGVLLALFFLIIVATIDLPNLPKNVHERLFWTLSVRETAFACGAMVLAGSVWPRGSWAGAALIRAGRTILAPIFVFYAIEHFLFPKYVPGVPLEKLIPAGFPAPTLLSYFVGIVLLLAGVGLLIPRATGIAAAGSGTVLLVLTALFYLPIFLMEFHTPLAVEGINYVGDTLLFAATALLAGFDGVGEVAMKKLPGEDRVSALEVESWRTQTS